MKRVGSVDMIGGTAATAAGNGVRSADERHRKRKASPDAAMNRQAVKALLGWYERALATDCELTAEQLTSWLIMQVYSRFVRANGQVRMSLQEMHLVADTPEPGDAPAESLAAILDAYPFTVQESKAAEDGAALDPSLLGTLFENLLDSGIFTVPER